MRLKYYLRGLGIGIIGAAIILAISFSVSSKDKALEDNDTEVVAQEQQQETEKPEDTESGKLSDLENNKEESDEVKPGPEDEPESADTDSDKDESDLESEEQDVTDEENTPDETVDEPAPASAETIEKFEIMVAPGEYSDAVCKKLERAGIIDDATEFNKYLNKNKYDNKLQPGVFIVEKGLSYEELAVILTTKTKK